MKKVMTLMAAALFLGACHCTCTKNACSQKKAEKAPVAQQPAAKKQVVAQPAAKPAPKKATEVADKDFAEVANVSRKSADTVVLSFKEPINFAYNSDQIAAESKTQLKKTAQALKKYPNNKVRVAGYTDSLGDPNYNLDLSQRRAKAVAMELVKEGVPAENVSFIGYGASRFIATNKTREGRYKNRRVELEVSNK